MGNLQIVELDTDSWYEKLIEPPEENAPYQVHVKNWVVRKLDILILIQENAVREFYAFE